MRPTLTLSIFSAAILRRDPMVQSLLARRSISTGLRSVTAGLSVATAAGALYEVDTRLRPSGNARPSGRLARQFRALPARGGLDLGAYGAHPRPGAVRGPRKPGRKRTPSLMRCSISRASLRILSTRRPRCADIAAHKPPSPLDVKLCDGGLVDLEFTVQVMQLVHRKGLVPNLGDAVDTLVGAGLLPQGLSDAYRLLSRFGHRPARRSRSGDAYRAHLRAHR